MKPTPKETSSHERADGWFTPGRFAAILAALIFISFPLVVTGVETFFFRDFGAFGYPLAFYHRESFWRGEIPLWNPLNFCGLPFLAQWNTLTLYPLSLFYLIFPLSWSLGMFGLGHMFLAGMGMYFLAHRWTGNRLAAAVAGAVFAFNGLSWHSLMWPNNIAALGWMPWVLLTSERAWREGRRRIVVAGLVGAMQMLSGAPEIIFLTWVATGVFWLVELMRGEGKRLWAVGRFLCVVGLVSGLAAAQLMPFLDLLSHSQRGSRFGETQAAMPMPLTGWLNYLVPLFHMLTEAGLFGQHEQYWTASYYLGAGTVALVFLALWQKRNWRTWTLAGLAAFALVTALGERAGLYAWLKQGLPFLGFMRYPIKFVALATLVIPLLAAQAIGGIAETTEKQWAAARKKIIQAGAVLLGAIALIAFWEWVAPGTEDDRLAVLINASVRAVFLALTLGCLVALRQVAEDKLRVLLRAALILLFWFDIATHMPNLNPTVDRPVYEPDTMREFFKWDKELRPGESRAFETRAAIMWIQLHSAPDRVADVNGRRLSLFANYNLLDHASKLDGEYSLDMREMDDVWFKLYWATNEPAKLEDFLGVARISDPVKAVDWLPRGTFLPMITAGQYPVVMSDDLALRTVLGDGFEPAQSVYLEPTAQGQITARGGPAKIIATDFTAERVNAEVEAAAPSMVVVAQAYYHDWHAYVDGKPARLWRANYAFQALEVPAGKHQVSLVYEDAAFKFGCVISLCSLLLAGAGLIWLRKRPSSPAPN